MLNTNAVGQMAFCEGNECSADDGGDHEAGAFAGEFSEACEAEGEDGGEHDGVEEPDQDDAADGDMTGAHHGEHDQTAGDEGCACKGLACANAAQDRSADETTHHGSAPIEGDEVGGGFLTEATNLWQAEVVDEEAADGDFGTDVDEDADGSHDEVGMGPDAAAGAGLQLAGAEVAGEVGGGELDEGDGNGQGEKGDRDAEVRQAHGGGLLFAIGLKRCGGEGLDRFRGCFDGSEDEGSAEEGGDEGAEGVEGLREIEAAGGGCLRAKVGDVWVRGNLKAGDAGGEDDQSCEEQAVGCGGGGWEEEQGSGSHDDEADDHGLFVAAPLDQLARGQSEDEIGREEGELDEEGLAVVQAEDSLKVRDEDVVETGEEAPHEKEHRGDAHGADVGGLWVAGVGG